MLDLKIFPCQRSKPCPPLSPGCREPSSQMCRFKKATDGGHVNRIESIVHVKMYSIDVF